ncbi:MAG TPA: histidine kinase [Actinotalea sp.]
MDQVSRWGGRWRELESRVAQGVRPRADLFVTLLVLAAMLTTLGVRQGALAFPGPSLLVATAAAWLPLLARSRWPLRALVLTVLAEAVHLAVLPLVGSGDLSASVVMGAYQPVPLATMVAAWTVAARAPRPIGWTAGGTAASVLLAASLLGQPHSLLATDVVMFDLVLIATGAGAVAAGRRDRVARLERERVQGTQQAITDERLRIARELHDVLAHNLVLVNAQASVAEYLLRSDPAAATRALQDISRHTGRAIDDLRATVGLLRRDDESGGGDDLRPVPGIARLPELVAALEAAGARITVTTTGTPLTLGEHADLAAFRIVQESLTNAVKHAPGSPIEVRLDWSDQQLALRVANGPAAHGLPAAPRTGHGLVGMRERARAAGGSLEVRRPAPGGFVVEAVLPEVSR